MAAIVTCPACAPHPCVGLSVLIGTSGIQSIYQHKPSGTIVVPDEETKEWWLQRYPNDRVVVVPDGGGF